MIGPQLPILIFVLGVCLVIMLAIIGGIQARKRREAFQALALQLGLEYEVKDRHGIPARFEFLNRLRQGSNRYANNILHGVYQGHPVCMFDYHYETHSTDSKGRQQTHHHTFSVFVLEQPVPFPELCISPEGFLQNFFSLLGFEDINFESHEFSKAFHVTSKDRKFAYDICHTRMMAYLLEHRDLSIEIEGQFVALFFNACLNPEEIEVRLRQLIEIRELFPEYLYRP